MPIVARPYCESPLGETVLWRYLNVWKYRSLLETRSVYFARPDQFARDPSDSKVPPGDRRTAGTSVLSEVVIQGVRLLRGGGWVPDLVDDEVRVRSAVSCWSVAGHELDSLWNYAGDRSQGVVVRTTWERLKSSMSRTEREVVGGVVEYIDPDIHTTPVDQWNVFRWAFQKQRGFQDDRELRLLTTDWPTKGGEVETHGRVLVPVDIVLLVEDVRVSPRASPAFRDSVARVSLDHGLSVPVRFSELADGVPSDAGVSPSIAPG